jgi:hypothetical protein
VVVVGVVVVGAAPGGDGADQAGDGAGEGGDGADQVGDGASVPDLSAAQSLAPG